MSLSSDRIAVGMAVGRREHGGSLQQWLDRHDQAMDGDGDQVICAFGPNEPAAQMMAEVFAYPHAVVVATIVGEHVAAMEMGSSRSTSHRVSSDAEVIKITDEIRVRDIFRKVTSQPPGTPFILELAGDRALVTA